MRSHSNEYDVIVVGAGHAGVEAALAAAKLGCQTLLLTSNLDTIAQMSCNPAIGGMAKSQLVREIDAIGGEMGLAADQTGIQFRMLNTGKGPAVWATRIQCDKKSYQFYMKRVVELQPRLSVKQEFVEELTVVGNRVTGVVTRTGIKICGKAVILTTGTFLSGLIHIGETSYTGGRAGEPAADKLSCSLRNLGYEVGRFKTGTPPRIHMASVDLSKVQVQHGDNQPSFLSYRTPPSFHVEQLPCYVTCTTDETAWLIRSNLHRSAMYSGQIKGIGPRYCPSIEDKIVRFPNKSSHQVFLEPEGRTTQELYVNGISTSLPEEIQLQVIRSVVGLKHAEIMRPAYAIEYDYVPPQQLHSTLETKRTENLYFAGQINGTSGYEEAAAQGIVAGINAAYKTQGRHSCCFARSSSYIGVLIDDLVTKGVDEPYRMFTSRAEYRLQLRQDNADLRLTPIGHQIGLVGDAQWNAFVEKRSLIDSEMERLHNTREGTVSYADILRRPDISYASLPSTRADIPFQVQQQIEIQIKYEGYILRELERIRRATFLDAKSIPSEINYHEIRALRFESRQKLSKIRPDSIGQASRVSGVTPSDVAVLLVWLKKHDSRRTSNQVRTDAGSVWGE